MQRFLYSELQTRLVIQSNTQESMYTPAKLPRKTPRREKTNLSSDSDTDRYKEPVHVYCRLKPVKNENDEVCFEVISGNEIATVSPASKFARKEMQYTFKEVFAAGSTQKDVFESVAYPMLEDLLQGKDSLLFTYGVTGSGKTYTLTGDQNDPGIMPRCINTLFNTISDYQTNKYIIKSDKMNGFEIQTEKDAANDRYIESKSSTGSLQKKKNQEGKLFYVNDDLKVRNFNDKNVYAVFISYIEIYNNTVFDLLDESGGKQLQSKILREDYQKNMYVNNVVEIEVKSAIEAFDLFNTGQKRKRMGQTLLNAESSRSHSIFNIRVVQIERSAPGHDSLIPERNVFKLSRLSLVDLAGSERTNRTQNTGQRLKEASSINNSLMSLRTCMEILRDNQMNSANRLVPYRDSRLTLLFKNYFEGEGRMRMIVCVNPSAQDFEENLQVMKFAEVTQEVKIGVKTSRYTPHGKIQRIKIAPPTPTPLRKPQEAPALLGPKIPSVKFNLETPDEFIAAVNRLMHCLKARKENSTAYDADCAERENHFRSRLIEMDKENALGRSEIRNLKAAMKNERKKTGDLECKVLELQTVNNNLACGQDELHDVIRNLKGALDEKDLKINQNILQQERTKQKFAMKQERAEQELDACLRRQREELNAQSLAKELKLQKVKRIIEDDHFAVPPMLLKVDSEVQTAREPQVDATTSKTPSTSRSRAANSVQPGHRYRRRSRSAGEVWLEHNSVKPVALGTVLQPSIKKRKSVTKLTKAADVTNPKQSKYCLIAQETDSVGELETKVYKGDILPTCGGGAQVIFNDVERLRQESPTASPQ